ncbi:unnamed protein product [Closterium sp. NIES-64]|nr:unnamed protein product [Closterium sp. NIES-64]
MVVDVDAARAKIPADPTIPLLPGTKGAPEPEPDRYSPRSDTEQPPPIGPFPENDCMYLTVEDLLAADEKDDAFLQKIPRDDFAEAAFDINKELAKKNRLLRMMWGFRHLDTLEARTTRVQYLRALLDFRRWCCANLPRQQTARVKGDGVLEHEDEIGRYIDEDMAWKVEGTLFGVKELHIMYDISEVRSEVRAMVREKWHRDDRDCVDRHRGTLGDTYTTDQIRHLMFKVLPTWAARAYEPKAATPSQTLWNFLLMKTMTLLGHHTLLRGAKAGRQGVPRSDIADLGHQALDKLAKSYITTIPKAAVLRKAGYTGKRGDYHLGRSMVKPDDKVVALIAQHIFPWAEAELAKVNVVHPWRTSKTVEAAWRWWNNPSNFDSRPLREHYDEHRFLVRHTRMICKVEKGDKPAASAKSAKSSRPTTEVGETGKNDALQQCTRRMRRIMEAVHDLWRSDDAADTAAVIKLLDHLGRAGLSTFSDALLVLRATPPIKVPTTADGKLVGIKGLDKPLARKLAVAWGVVTAGYMDADWGKRLFGDLGDERANKAGLEAEATAGAIGEGKRKRAG